MSLAQTQCTSFKVELMQALHDFTTTTGNTFKIALYTAFANLGPNTTVYTTDNEVVGTNYVAGGATLTNITPTSGGTTAYVSFQPATFTNVSIVVRGALIYNATNGNRAVAVLDFGSDITKVGQNFVITFPLASATDAIIRIA